MELSRPEYPALLTSLQPAQAVVVLNDRVQTIDRVNSEVAEWLAERRSIEDAYVNGLRRLASRRLNATQLGVFQTPWQSIVTTCESLADSHNTLSQKIRSDVEKPLREYSGNNREMIGIKTTQGNMTSLAKDVEKAQKRSEKIMVKGNKADNAELSQALSSVQDAQQQWESQAPYVFEQLQALDEQRVNHLRDVLTQLQTHQSDQLERSRVTVASSLEAILNVDTSEEISTFVARTTGAAPALPPPPPAPRRMGRLSASSTSRPSAAGFAAPPVPEVPRSLTVPAPANDRRGLSPSASESRERSAAPEASPLKKSGLSGLRRLGTVMKRNKDPKPTSGPSTEKKPKQSRNPLKRGTSGPRNTMYQLGSPNTSMTELADTSSMAPSQTPADRAATSHGESTNGAPGGTVVGAAVGGAAVGGAAVVGAVAAAEAASTPSQTVTSPQTNGSAVSAAQQESQEKPAEPASQTEASKESEKPPSAVDDITRAQQEAAAVSHGDQPQFNVNIQNEPIMEEQGDSEKAISDTANMLRQGAQPPQRKTGTLRGRRDVRNTMFVPANVASELANIGGDQQLTSPPTDGVRTNPLASLSPLGAGRVPDDASSAADAQSIRSTRSLSSLGTSALRHPELTQAGLNGSIIETISATLANGEVTKVTAVGEIALAYNGEHAAESESLRLDNFQVLEKVAPNPGFINQIEGRSGEYTVNLPSISHQQVGFKYQIHLDDSNLASYAPVILTPIWKVEPLQTSVILNYAFNPAFASEKRAAYLQNAVVMISIENAKASACQSKPTGTFSREKGMIYWRLGDVQLEAESATGKLLARFTTDAEAAPGTVEARWEIAGDHAVGVGSGLGLSSGAVVTKDESNPFADEGATYKEVPVQRKLMSGKYVAS